MDEDLEQNCYSRTAKSIYRIGLETIKRLN